jgi:hypothetical protein
MLLNMDNLPAADRKTVQLQLLSLPPRLDAAKEAEVGQMMGKLKEVCPLSPQVLRYFIFHSFFYTMP